MAREVSTAILLGLCCRCVAVREGHRAQRVWTVLSVWHACSCEGFLGRTLCGESFQGKRFNCVGWTGIHIWCVCALGVCGADVCVGERVL